MRRRLAFLSLAVASLVVVAFLVPVGILIRNQAQSSALRSAERDSQSVAAALAVAGSSDQQAAVTQASATSILVAFGEPEDLSVVLPDDTIVGSDFEPTGNLAQARRGAAFTARTVDGVEVLVPVLLSDPVEGDSAVVVRAFVPEDALNEGVAVAWAMLVGLGIAIIVIAVFAADRLGRSVVRPVTALSDAAHRWGAGELDTRVTPDGPAEIAEVGEAFNSLAGRLDSLLVAERESVADLSHRLRTPLTALRLQSERLPDTEESAALRADIDELEHAVDLLIQQARGPAVEETAHESADLGQVVAHRAAFWQVLADEQGRPTSIRIEAGEHPVALSKAELGALVDVVVENVFSHTRVGSGYRIGVASLPDDRSQLVVSDEGEGFADLEVVRRGRSGAGSTGLGLDIVMRAAERTGGGVTIATAEEGGALVTIVLGQSRPDGHGV